LVGINVAGAAIALKIERLLLPGARVLFAPQIYKERRQDTIHHLEAVDYGVVAGAQGNQESLFGIGVRNARPAVMDMDAPAAARTAAHPAGAAIAGDHPRAQTAKVSPVPDFPGVAGEAEALFALSFPAAASAPQEGLAGPI
jgi:hypothetical protein